MDFMGHLNFYNTAIMFEGSEQDQAAFLAARVDKPTLIRDARDAFSVLESAEDSTALLTDGVGFLLARSPSAVKDWTNVSEVQSGFYEEARALVQRLLPTAEIPTISSHAYRNEDIKDHHVVDGIMYGPCAGAVHNDHADFVSEDGRTVTRKFTDVISLPDDRRILGINVWRSVSPGPLARFPLTVCDRTSIDPDDLEYDLNPNGGGSGINMHNCKPNDGQRWYYYSDMTPDEVLVFITYDSHPSDGEIFRPTMHSAVTIPGSEGLQPRESVEVRFFAQLPLPV
jgi:hypothetical protein